MRPGEIRRIYADVEERLEGVPPSPADIEASVYRDAMATVAFSTGWLLGGDNPYGAMMMIALAERVFGADALHELKRKVGLVGLPEGAPPLGDRFYRERDDG